VHQLRLAGALAEIRAVGLRFTERQRAGISPRRASLSEVDAALLHPRTEAWRAGADHPGAVAAFPSDEDFRGPGLVRAASYLNQGRLDEAAAHLAVERHAETTPPGRRRRLQVAIASLKVSLARRRDHLAGVTNVVHGASQAAGRQPSPSAEELSPRTICGC
jgi:hypothetical protein